MRKILRITVAAALIVAFCGIVTLTVITDPDVMVNSLGAFDPAPLDKLTEKYDIYDKNDEYLCSVSARGNRKIPLADLPAHTKNAFIAIEDARFYEHGAVDVQRIGSALWKDLTTMSAKEGASTITQQLVKNTYLSPEKTVTRKLREIRIARGVESKLTKDEILELYLNSLYFGNNIYGIETASQRFFGKSASLLTLDESAALAGIINNPGKYDPFTQNDRMESRKRLVLKRMCELGYISAEERDAASRNTIFADSVANNRIFIGYALDEAGHSHIRTAYDNEIQDILESAINAEAVSCDYTVAVVAISVETEQVVAAAANSYADLSDVRRQPGSTIKPLLCYAPALDSGVISPVTPLLDEPTDFGGYKPQNYSGKYYGWVSAQESLSKSLNIPAVKLLNMVGTKAAKETAMKLGIRFTDGDSGLALALGGMEYGTDLRTLGRAYAKIAAGGKGAIKAETAYFINTMLSDCAQNGTAKLLTGIKNVAAKTGTVGSGAGNTDAYCIAYNTKYVVVAWAGAENGMLPDDVTGGTLTAKLCAQIFKRPAMKSGAFEKPKTVVSIDLDANELQFKHRIIPAGTTTLPKDRVSAEFSIYYLPERKTQEDLSYGDYDNFKIVDGFTD